MQGFIQKKYNPTEGRRGDFFLVNPKGKTLQGKSDTELPLPKI
jgi:hypothetical protein